MVIIQRILHETGRIIAINHTEVVASVSASENACNYFAFISYKR